MTVFTRHWVNQETQTCDPKILHDRGPALAVSISVPDDVAALLTTDQKAVPNAVSGTALIDTGAGWTAIDIEILTALGLTPKSTIPVIGPTGAEEQGVFQVKIEFTGTGIPAFEQMVIGSKIAGFNHASLVGRDILQHFLMVYNGIEGTWSLAI